MPMYDLFLDNLATVLAPKSLTDRASTHLVRWSIATMMYLTPIVLGGNGPTKYIDTVCHAISV